MINKLKLFGPAAALLLVLSSGTALSSCGGSGPSDLTYWCPSTDTSVMAEIVADFKADNPDYANKNIDLLANIAEGDTYTELHKDQTAAADVMLMADDNIRAGVESEELQALSATETAAITTSDGASAASAVTYNGSAYGYPYRGDNVPLMLYDKTVFTDTTKLAKIEDALAVCKTAGKKFYLDIGNGWYNPFMFWAAGVTFKADKLAGDTTTKVYTDATKIAGAATSCQALYDLYGQYKDTWVSNSTTGTIEGGFKDKSIGVAFMWNDLSVIQSMNANVTVTSWPSMNIDGTDVPLTCFNSYKAVVVKSDLDETTQPLALAFAKYLASEKAQTRRLTELQYGPSNLTVLATEAAQSNPWIKNISVMAAANRTRNQAASVTASFWTPIGNFGILITDQKNWGSYGNATRAIKGLVSNDGWAVMA